MCVETRRQQCAGQCVIFRIIIIMCTHTNTLSLSFSLSRLQMVRNDNKATRSSYIMWQTRGRSVVLCRLTDKHTSATASHFCGRVSPGGFVWPRRVPTHIIGNNNNDNMIRRSLYCAYISFPFTAVSACDNNNDMIRTLRIYELNALVVVFVPASRLGILGTSCA